MMLKSYLLPQMWPFLHLNQLMQAHNLDTHHNLLN